MDAALLAALGEGNRLRIVELLGTAPRPVGEIAAALDLRQPQATKHLQTLERAGLVRAHRLGRRRVYSLRPEPLHALAAWAADHAREHPSQDALLRYERAIVDEERRPADDRSTRLVRVRRTVPGPVERVWAAWTDAELVRAWWSPQHFQVARCTVEPTVGGRLEIVLVEGDGTEHRARGRFTHVDDHRRLGFDLSPEGPAGRPALHASHVVRFVPAGDRTLLTVRVRASDLHRDAAPVVAGMRLGWEQTLDKLAGLLAG
jgi:uncharacterized protein YndB with AHSA1/START domain/DNA-binding transcriptional ArsR family regulator